MMNYYVLNITFADLQSDLCEFLEQNGCEINEPEYNNETSFYELQMLLAE